MHQSTHVIMPLTFDRDHLAFSKVIQGINRKGIRPTVTLTGFVVYDGKNVAGQDNSRRIDLSHIPDPTFGMLDEQEVLKAINATYGSTFPDTCTVSKALEVTYGEPV